MSYWKVLGAVALCVAVSGEARADSIKPSLHPIALRAAPQEARVAACANLAAMRTLDAKAKGASYPAQARLLNLTFVLCMRGATIEG